MQVRFLSPRFYGGEMADKVSEIRQAAWGEINRRRDMGYTSEQVSLFMAGLFFTFRLCNFGAGPLFTWDGTGDGVPSEVK